MSVRVFALVVLALTLSNPAVAQARDSSPFDSDVFKVVQVVKTCASKESQWVGDDGYRWRYSERNRYNGEVGYRWGGPCKSTERFVPRLIPESVAAKMEWPPGQRILSCMPGGYIRARRANGTILDNPTLHCVSDPTVSRGVSRN